MAQNGRHHPKDASGPSRSGPYPSARELAGYGVHSGPPQSAYGYQPPPPPPIPAGGHGGHGYGGGNPYAASPSGGGGGYNGHGPPYGEFP